MSTIKIGITFFLIVIIQHTPTFLISEHIWVKWIYSLRFHKEKKNRHRYDIIENFKGKT